MLNVNQLWLKLRACKNLVFNKNSFIYGTGWINSIEHLAPVDKDLSPIPWMNYHFIEFLSARLHNSLVVFEYGSGYSTSFWAGLVKSVTSVEYDKDWFDKVKTNLPVNVKLIFNDDLEGGEYAKTCKVQNNKFDVVIVDGRNRIDCIKYALSGLKDDGVIVLDDSHRERYKGGFQLLKENGFKEITITGIKPVSSSFASTTIFYKSSNCLNI